MPATPARRPTALLLAGRETRRRDTAAASSDRPPAAAPATADTSRCRRHRKTRRCVLPDKTRKKELRRTVGIMRYSFGIMKVALVTGGARGIGRGVAIALASRGWRVAFCWRKSEADACATLEALGDRGLSIRADVSIPEEA